MILLDESCEHCGEKQVYSYRWPGGCLLCGAPNCCLRCCKETTAELSASTQTQHEAVPGAWFAACDYFDVEGWAVFSPRANNSVKIMAVGISKIEAHDIAQSANDLANQATEALRAEVQALRGMKFSDRMYAAIKSRMEIAEAEVAKLKAELAERDAKLAALTADDDHDFQCVRCHARYTNGSGDCPLCGCTSEEANAILAQPTEPAQQEGSGTA